MAESEDGNLGALTWELRAEYAKLGSDIAAAQAELDDFYSRNDGRRLNITGTAPIGKQPDIMPGANDAGKNVAAEEIKRDRPIRPRVDTTELDRGKASVQELDSAVANAKRQAAGLPPLVQQARSDGGTAGPGERELRQSADARRTFIRENTQEANAAESLRPNQTEAAIQRSLDAAARKAESIGDKAAAAFTKDATRQEQKQQRDAQQLDAATLRRQLTTGTPAERLAAYDEALQRLPDDSAHRQRLLAGRDRLQSRITSQAEADEGRGRTAAERAEADRAATASRRVREQRVVDRIVERVPEPLRDEFRGAVQRRVIERGETQVEAARGQQQEYRESVAQQTRADRQAQQQATQAENLQNREDVRQQAAQTRTGRAALDYRLSQAETPAARAALLRDAAGEHNEGSAENLRLLARANRAERAGAGGGEDEESDSLSPILKLFHRVGAAGTAMFALGQIRNVISGAADMGFDENHANQFGDESERLQVSRSEARSSIFTQGRAALGWLGDRLGFDGLAAWGRDNDVTAVDQAQASLNTENATVRRDFNTLATNRKTERTRDAADVINLRSPLAQRNREATDEFIQAQRARDDQRAVLASGIAHETDANKRSDLQRDLAAFDRLTPGVIAAAAAKSAAVHNETQYEVSQTEYSIKRQAPELASRMEGASGAAAERQFRRQLEDRYANADPMLRPMIAALNRDEEFAHEGEENEQQNRVEASIGVSELKLQRKPLAADLASIEEQRREALKYAQIRPIREGDAGKEDEAWNKRVIDDINAKFGVDSALVKQQFNDRGTRITEDLDTRKVQLDALMGVGNNGQPDETKAQAAGTLRELENESQDLSRAGFKQQAADAKANGIERLQVEKREFLNDFHGVAVDAGAIDFSNPRNTVDIGHALGNFNSAITDAKKFNPNDAPVKPAGEGGGGNSMGDMITFFKSGDFVKGIASEFAKALAAESTN